MKIKHGFRNMHPLVFIICPFCGALFPLYDKLPRTHWKGFSTWRVTINRCRRCKREFKLSFSLKRALSILPFTWIAAFLKDYMIDSITDGHNFGGVVGFLIGQLSFLIVIISVMCAVVIEFNDKEKGISAETDGKRPEPHS